MEGHESVVVNTYLIVGVIYRRAEQRVADDLSPMLPSGVGAVVIVVVGAGNVVADVLRAVVVVWTALVFRIEILEHDVSQPCAILDVHLCSEHHVFEAIHEVAAVLPCVPLLALSVAVIVEQEHLAVVLEEMVGIHAQSPCLGVVVYSHHPAAQDVALLVAIHSVCVVLSSGKERVPERFEAFFGRNGNHLALSVALVWCAAKLGSHLQSHLQTQRIQVLVFAYAQISSLRVV